METLEVRNIELSGTNYEIGYRLGELVANMPEIIEGQINKSNVVSKKEEKEMIELFDKYCPGLNEELQGFADAIQVNCNQILYYTMTYLKPGCSQVALAPELTENGHVLFARNFDFSHNMEDFVLCKTKVNGKYAHIGTTVMQFGRGEGMNECGLGVSQSSCGIPVGNSDGLRKPAIVGLQFWAVIRYLLENCKDVDEALEYLKDMPIAYNINLLLADKSGNIALVETLDGKKEVNIINSLESKREYFLHSTNHTHIDKLHKLEPQSMKNSIHRYKLIKEYINKSKKIGEKELMNLLSSKYPNGLSCNYYNDFFGTLKSIVMDLNIGKFNILWGGLENKWESYYLKNDIKSITQRININIEKAPSDFFDFIE
ncbi:choloylglycine hydrolase [Clostridioides difficile]|uniref:C45 family autoproteolytic acyltransferase/hydolase n=1 Tax=Clostridioides difficile TaxID=1496 RepID=UPI0010BC58C6|nr:C45 family peptidase [Clostridioides difficile]VHX65815.1 choloylglycine hydrolase [Clostridioides difficile]